jgi:hypothetical protein
MRATVMDSRPASAGIDCAGRFQERMKPKKPDAKAIQKGFWEFLTLHGSPGGCYYCGTDRKEVIHAG